MDQQDLALHSNLNFLMNLNFLTNLNFLKYR
jgi:hypothetical protein